MKAVTQNSKEDEELRKHMTSPKDNHSLITKIKDMKFCDLADKEFKIAVLKKPKSSKKTQKNNSTK